jgi:dinuclear metal center YbgI/SA1388 family protein
LTQIKHITQHLESIAPLSYQEGYDNCGLIVGDPDAEVTGVMLCLDSTEAVIDEAIEKGCNLVIAHHPIVFKGMKKFNGRNYVERTVIKAIKNDVAIYAIHTNLDHIHTGVNAKIGEKLGLQNLQILSSKRQLLRKLVTFAPHADADKVRNALFAAGAGHIGEYSEASFNLVGTGTFKGSDNSNPHVGNKGERHQEPETRIETIFPAHLEGNVIGALKVAHPYEELAYDIFVLENENAQVGAGMVGELTSPVDEAAFIQIIKIKLNAAMVRYTALLGKPVSKVAWCGGSGSFLLQDAIRAGAQVYITGDFKYHEFFDAENKIVIADIGHYESEQFTPEIIHSILQKKFSNFALYFTQVNTNPINYV